MTEGETDQTKEEERIARLVSEARVHALVYGAAFAGFVWLCFGGLLNGTAELLGSFLPHFFANGYTFAIMIGIGGLLLHQATTGESWFNRFHKDDFHKYHRPWKGVLFGLTSFIGASTFLIGSLWLFSLLVSD